jgi:hypothetical protein
MVLVSSQQTTFYGKGSHGQTYITLGYVGERHFQKYFSYVVAVSFIS